MDINLLTQLIGFVTAIIKNGNTNIIDIAIIFMLTYVIIKVLYEKNIRKVLEEFIHEINNTENQKILAQVDEIAKKIQIYESGVAEINTKIRKLQRMVKNIVRKYKKLLRENEYYRNLSNIQKEIILRGKRQQHDNNY